MSHSRPGSPPGAPGTSPPRSRGVRTGGRREGTAGACLLARCVCLIPAAAVATLTGYQCTPLPPPRPLPRLYRRVLYSLGDVKKLVGLVLDPFIKAVSSSQYVPHAMQLCPAPPRTPRMLAARCVMRPCIHRLGMWGTGGGGVRLVILVINPDSVHDDGCWYGSVCREGW